MVTNREECCNHAAVKVQAIKKIRNVGAILNSYGETLSLKMSHPPTLDQLLHFESHPIANTGEPQKNKYWT